MPVKTWADVAPLPEEKWIVTGNTGTLVINVKLPDSVAFVHAAQEPRAVVRGQHFGARSAMKTSGQNKTAARNAGGSRS